MEKYEVIVSERVYTMLGSHIKFLKAVSPDAAKRLKGDVVKAIRSLSKMPERVTFFDAAYIPPNKYHKLLVKPRYLILFQIKDRRVYVDYLLDCRQDYEWLL